MSKPPFWMTSEQAGVAVVVEVTVAVSESVDIAVDVTVMISESVDTDVAVCMIVTVAAAGQFDVEVAVFVSVIVTVGGTGQDEFGVFEVEVGDVEDLVEVVDVVKVVLEEVVRQLHALEILEEPHVDTFVGVGKALFDVSRLLGIRGRNDSRCGEILAAELGRYRPLVTIKPYFISLIESSA